MKLNKFTQFKLKTALTSAVVIFAAPSFAVELLSNGGFESGSTGWTITRSEGGTSMFFTTTDPRTGLGAFYAFDNVAPGLSLSQSVTSGSDTKTLSFLIKTVYGSGTSRLDDLSVSLDGSTYTVRGYVKTTIDLTLETNTVSFTFGDKPRQNLSLTGSYTLFSYDYIFGPSSSDTQSSLTTLSKNLRSSFNATVMSSNYANMNTYDCNLFDKNNMCISAGGRVTTIDNPSSHHSAAVVVLGYKISPHIRIGGFLDQSVNHNMPSGVDMSNKNPMAGAFAVWNHQADGLGLQMKLANAYLDKDVTTSRAVVGTSEAGRGRTDLNTQSYVGELSYAFQYQEKTLVRPYFALRYTRIKQDGYTEDTTAAVTSPLTYAKLSDRSTSALMGVKVNHALTPKTNLTASLGVEQDLDHKSDQLIATGVSGLTSENFNNNIRHTRPVASLGAYYAVAKNQRLSGDIYYQQLPFQSTDSATAYVNYMIGF
ncbi:Autotransporter beta-domain containing protein [Candidatus Methylopumilus universalis]|uniref:autotransporter outer membrane beta-barrel domain-containing protein n=1 Tax=Candidatus Methylopumilus universalis TaxID=2588536 RepID=UPI003BEEF81D